jgi:hypothetical protein
VSIDLEQRLREYGTTIDAATAADLVQRDAPVIETSVVRIHRGTRRAMKTVAVLTIAGIALFSAIALARHSHPTVVAPPSTSPTASSTLPSRGDCLSETLTVAQRRTCIVRRAHENRPHYSNVGSGTDGLPTPAQQATLAREKAQYDPAEVQLLLNQAKANGNVPTDQALVSVLEFRNACRQLLVAATAAESVPAERVASVVDPIVLPEVSRLTARQPAGSESNQLFAGYTREIDAGHAAKVLRAIGRNFCIDVIAPQP